MKSKVVAILETRTGEHLGEMIERKGFTSLLAPALEEVPDIEPPAVLELLERWRARPFDTVIFQTGVGTRALFEAADRAGASPELSQRLALARIVVRGPKPVGELAARHIRIDLRAASPFTTETVLQALADVPMHGGQVLVQRYGAANVQLRETLQSRGAAVEEIATYRWSLPRDLQPLHDLLDALQNGRVDAVVFTSAVQMHNLHAVALQRGVAAQLPQQLNGLVIASIGPVCSKALMSHGVAPTCEASPPKLGPLLMALERALSDHR